MRANVFHAPASDNDNRRSKLGAGSLFAFPDVRFHADGTVVFEKNARDLVVGQQFAARRCTLAYELVGHEELCKNFSLSSRHLHCIYFSNS